MASVTREHLWEGGRRYTDSNAPRREASQAEIDEALNAQVERGSAYKRFYRMLGFADDLPSPMPSTLTISSANLSRLCTAFEAAIADASAAQRSEARLNAGIERELQRRLAELVDETLGGGIGKMVQAAIDKCLRPYRPEATAPAAGEGA